MKLDITQLSTDEIEMLVAQGIEVLIAREPDADLFVLGALDEALTTRPAMADAQVVH